MKRSGCGTAYGTWFIAIMLAVGQGLVADGAEMVGPTDPAPQAATGTPAAVSSTEQAPAPTGGVANAVSEGTQHMVEIKTEGAAAEDLSPQPGSATNLISVTLDQVPLQDVVRMFTRISGANIIASASNLQGTVTVNLQDVEWKPALSAILDMNSLALMEKAPGSGVYSIIPKPPGAPEPLLVETFQLHFASVSNITSVITPLLAPGGTLAPYPSLNVLVARSTAASLSDIRQVILSIDKPRKQVYIEAKFVDLSDAAMKDIGINWEVLQAYRVDAKLDWNVSETRTWTKGNDSRLSQTDNRRNVDALNQRYDINGIPYQETENTYVEGPPGTFNLKSVITPTRVLDDSITRTRDVSQTLQDTFLKNIQDVRTAVLSPQQFHLILSALKQLSGVSVVSNPKILVANEEPATIHIGSQEPNIRGTVTPGQLGQANTTTYALDPVESYFKIGIFVEVTPTINTESNITVKIFPTLSRAAGNKTAPDGTTFPITSTKTIKTVFNLESGKTAAIGGLTETQESDATTKVPMLGDIPLLGKYLFSHTSKQKVQTETIIFVTVALANPENLSQDTGLPDDTELTQRHMLKTEMSKQQRRMDAEKNKAEGYKSLPAQTKP